MLTADSADRKNTFRVAFMTGASLLVMGYVNGMAQNTYDLGVMITPQTGNVIWMGLNAASGYWGLFFENLSLFFGFMSGAVLALYTQNVFKGRLNQARYNWTVFSLPVMLYFVVLQYFAPSFLSYFLLGIAMGAALGFFRKMYHMEINNAMATGNVRFLGIHFAGAFIKKNKKEVATFWVFFTCVFLFGFGAFLYATMAQLDYNLGINGSGYVIGLGDPEARLFRQTFGLGEDRIKEASSNIARVIGALVICIVPYFFCPKNAVVEAEQK